MHKFNLEIELEDKNYCVGCPHISKRKSFCRYYKIHNTHRANIEEPEWTPLTIRPDICKQNDTPSKV